MPLIWARISDPGGRSTPEDRGSPIFLVRTCTILIRLFIRKKKNSRATPQDVTIACPFPTLTLRAFAARRIRTRGLDPEVSGPTFLSAFTWGIMEHELEISGTIRVVILDSRESTSPDAPLLETGSPPEERASLSEAPPSMANVRFGDTATTTPFPPTTPEDGRGAEAASVDPYRTVIRPGGAVTFHIPPFQQLAIYEPGVRLEEIRIEKETLFPASFGPFSITNYLVDDPHGRLLLSPEPKQEAQGPSRSWASTS